ncbi:MAG TPA: CBS domain-containing protein [Propylenella sp.]|nr:CBS domain-containing protein [Propylenella sp.]
MKIEQVLRNKGNRIVSVRIDSTVEQTARVLRKENIGAVVVKDVCGSEGDTVVGMFSERDVVRALVDQGAGALQTPVWRLMSRSIISCSPGDDVEYALQLMDRHRIRHLPVLENQHLIGVVSIRDLASIAAGLTRQGSQQIQAGDIRAAQ